MVEEKKEEDVEEGKGIGSLFFLITITVILIVGFGLYNYISHPFNVADELKDYVNDLDNITDMKCIVHIVEVIHLNYDNIL